MVMKGNNPKEKKKKAVLLLVCPDRPGIVAHVSDFVFRHGGNIVDSDQHTDFETGIFFMRIEWELNRPPASRSALEGRIVSSPAVLTWIMRFFSAIAPFGLGSSFPSMDTASTIS